MSVSSPKEDVETGGQSPENSEPMDRGDPEAQARELAYEFEVKEQDRWLPIANVARIMKTALPENAKIAKEAKECMQECVSEFISFITSEASEKCQQEKRKTVNGEDILFAMTSLGFENYAEALKIYLSKYREVGFLPPCSPLALCLSTLHVRFEAVNVTSQSFSTPILTITTRHSQPEERISSGREVGTGPAVPRGQAPRVQVVVPLLHHHPQPITLKAKVSTASSAPMASKAVNRRMLLTAKCILQDPATMGLDTNLTNLANLTLILDTAFHTPSSSKIAVLSSTNPWPMFPS
ncbi:MAG: hypothetical protein Q9174_004411 [Haloplaca sp. 1 TL-2023]